MANGDGIFRAARVRLLSPRRSSIGLIRVYPRLSAVALVVMMTGTVAAADDPAARALQQNQLQRQQQQDRLQLRMQQDQRAAQYPPADARQRQAMEQLELDQAQRQQQLHFQQQRAQQARPDLPSDDPGTRDAKAQIEQQRAARESRQQLQQFDRELQIQGAGNRMKDEGITRPVVPGRGTGTLAPSP